MLFQGIQGNIESHCTSGYTFHISCAIRRYLFHLYQKLALRQYVHKTMYYELYKVIIITQFIHNTLATHSSMQLSVILR